MSLAVIRKSHSFSAVPDELFRLDLSPVAFKILAWALGRPDTWQFYIGNMMRELRLTDKLWKRAKRELIESGFFIQKRHFGERNQIFWENVFTDAPLWGSKSAIPPVGTDGSGGNASSMDAQAGDIAEDVGSKVSKAAAEPESHQPKPKPRSRSNNQHSKIVIRIENQRDKDLIEDMLAVHSMDTLKEIAREVLAEGLQPFPSNIANKLDFPTHPRKRNCGGGGNATVKAKPWFMIGPEIEAKAKELGMKTTGNEAIWIFYNRVKAAAGVTAEMLRKSKVDFPNG